MGHKYFGGTDKRKSTDDGGDDKYSKLHCKKLQLAETVVKDPEEDTTGPKEGHSGVKDRPNQGVFFSFHQRNIQLDTYNSMTKHITQDSSFILHLQPECIHLIIKQEVPDWHGIHNLSITSFIIIILPVLVQVAHSRVL